MNKLGKIVVPEKKVVLRGEEMDLKRAFFWMYHEPVHDGARGAMRCSSCLVHEQPQRSRSGTVAGCASSVRLGLDAHCHADAAVATSCSRGVAAADRGPRGTGEMPHRSAFCSLTLDPRSGPTRGGACASAGRSTERG